MGTGRETAFDIGISELLLVFSSLTWPKIGASGFCYRIVVLFSSLFGLDVGDSKSICLKPHT
jgi:hypothetical protein